LRVSRVRRAKWLSASASHLRLPGRLSRSAVTAPCRCAVRSPSARETVAYLLNRVKAAAGGRELRGMAARIGVPY